MTNKTQTMLTIALTVAVSGLLVDRTIEPAQAQDCATAYDIESAIGDMRERVMTVETHLFLMGVDVETNQGLLIDALGDLAGITDLILLDQ